MRAFGDATTDSGVNREQYCSYWACSCGRVEDLITGFGVDIKQSGFAVRIPHT